MFRVVGLGFSDLLARFLGYFGGDGTGPPEGSINSKL